MITAMKYRTDKISIREHLQSITANLIHSLDALHLRRIIKSAQEFQIGVFPVHDCIIVDIIHINPMKDIISKHFNEIYKNPEGLLKAIYLSIMENNPHITMDPNIDKKIKRLMGSAKISATKHLFNY